MPRTLSLPGPSALSFEYLLDLVSTVTYNPPSRAPVVPKPIAMVLAKVAQAVWWPALCPDEVERRFMNDVDVPGDWDVVGVSPDEIEQYALTYLRRFRSSYVYRFLLPMFGVTDLHIQRKLCSTYCVSFPGWTCESIDMFLKVFF
jgi:NADH dehydrogenase (ubiquinone) 1 alpha subcomplex subunit 9